MEFHTADPADVLLGRVTDVYFERTERTLRARGIDRRVRAEFFVKQLPGDGEWAVLCGADDVVAMIEELALDVGVRALPDGTLFRAGEPVLEIEGRYLEFGRHETAFLGLMCQASGVATRAARCRLAAGPRPVVCFGARRVHPILAPAVERWAWIGGADGVAAILSAERIGIEPSGTMPHALVLLFGDTVEAAKAFHETLPPDVPRIVLVDTFHDERFEALRVAEALGPVLAGVRLDTPASRRGDLLAILREVRWELDLRGFRHVKLFVSGGLGESDILELNPAADAYGVGTYITAAPPVDVSMDLVEIEGRAASKRGKLSGPKSLWRCGACGADLLSPLGDAAPVPCPCGGARTDLLTPVYHGGERRVSREDAASIRARVLAGLRSGALGRAGGTTQR
jgi:nicotinate phosphoribosyltransferase